MHTYINTYLPTFLIPTYIHAYIHIHTFTHRCTTGPSKECQIDACTAYGSHGIRLKGLLYSFLGGFGVVKATSSVESQKTTKELVKVKEQYIHRMYIFMRHQFITEFPCEPPTFNHPCHSTISPFVKFKNHQLCNRHVTIPTQRKNYPQLIVSPCVTAFFVFQILQMPHLLYVSLVRAPQPKQANASETQVACGTALLRNGASQSRQGGPY